MYSFYIYGLDTNALIGLSVFNQLSQLSMGWSYSNDNTLEIKILVLGQYTSSNVGY